MKSLPPFTPLSAARIAAGCASRFRTSSPSLSAARVAHTSGTTDTPSLSGTRGTPCRTSEAAVRPRTRRHPPVRTVLTGRLVRTVRDIRTVLQVARTARTGRPLPSAPARRTHGTSTSDSFRR